MQFSVMGGLETTLLSSLVKSKFALLIQASITRQMLSMQCVLNFMLTTIYELLDWLKLLKSTSIQYAVPIRLDLTGKPNPVK